LFARALGARLATLAATRITGKSGYYDKAMAAYQSAMAEAKHEDSLSRGLPSAYSLDYYDNSNVLTVRGGY
jgi:hypothetical protein